MNQTTIIQIFTLMKSSTDILCKTTIFYHYTLGHCNVCNCPLLLKNFPNDE